MKNKHIKSYKESSEIKYNYNENINEKSQLTSDVELELIKFFESFSKKYKSIDRQWIVDRFNDNQTESFINYLENELIKTTR